jgi:uncharacterized protein YndB with AHSA1/START domain
MLQDATYREWTRAFSPGSYYRGDWSEGSKILFLGPNPDGTGEGGMVSRIKENRLHEYISIEHLGIIKDGVEDTTSEEATRFALAHENYTFTTKGDGTTNLAVDLDSAEEYEAMFDEMWPKALEALKALSEQAAHTTITVTATIAAPIENVWECFTDPVHIVKWNNASPDWHTPRATNDLRVGGRFLSRMEAKDGSAGFDFEGTYTNVVPHERIAYVMDDGRKVEVVFEAGDITQVTTTFDPETENTLEMQQKGWQSILDNFAQYVIKHSN